MALGLCALSIVANAGPFPTEFGCPAPLEGGHELTVSGLRGSRNTLRAPLYVTLDKVEFELHGPAIILSDNVILIEGNRRVHDLETHVALRLRCIKNNSGGTHSANHARVEIEQNADALRLSSEALDCVIER